MAAGFWVSGSPAAISFSLHPAPCPPCRPGGRGPAHHRQRTERNQTPSASVLDRPRACSRLPLLRPAARNFVGSHYPPRCRILAEIEPIQMEQDAWPYSVNTTKTAESIAKARVLCVGAGGIGCELLKTLVMTGFRDIEVRMIIPMPSLDRDRFNLCNCPHSAAPFKVQSFWRAAGGRPRHDRDEQPKPPVPVSQAPCRQLQGPGTVGGGGRSSTVSHDLPTWCRFPVRWPPRQSCVSAQKPRSLPTTETSRRTGSASNSFSGCRSS